MPSHQPNEPDHVKKVLLTRDANRVFTAIHPPHTAHHQRHDFSTRDPSRIKGSMN
jgi:hypothetical protein